MMTPTKKGPTDIPVKSDPSTTCQAVKSQSPHDKNPQSTSSKVCHDEFSYTFHKTLRNGSRYCCSCWRSEKECNAILKVFDNNQVSASGEQTSCCFRRNGILISGTISSGDECTDHMYQ